MTTPGPELDRQIAEEVCGWEIGKAGSEYYWPAPVGYQKFSTDHNAFFQYVVPAMREKGFHLDCNNQDTGLWWANFYYELEEEASVGIAHADEYDSLPLAGCLAALGAVRAMKGAK